MRVGRRVEAGALGTCELFFFTLLFVHAGTPRLPEILSSVFVYGERETAVGPTLGDAVGLDEMRNASRGLGTLAWRVLHASFSSRVYVVVSSSSDLVASTCIDGTVL